MTSPVPGSATVSSLPSIRWKNRAKAGSDAIATWISFSASPPYRRRAPRTLQRRRGQRQRGGKPAQAELCPAVRIHASEKLDAALRHARVLRAIGEKRSLFVSWVSDAEMARIHDATDAVLIELADVRGALDPDQFNRMRPVTREKFDVIRQAVQMVRQALTANATEWFDPELGLEYDAGGRRRLRDTGADVIDWLETTRRHLRDVCVTDVFGA
jgi:hypothetical protein